MLKIVLVAIGIYNIARTYRSKTISRGNGKCHLGDGAKGQRLEVIGEEIQQICACRLFIHSAI
jgi:hypothetical protein